MVNESGGRLRPEVHIGLVDDHHPVGVGGDDFFHLRQGQGDACGGVGVGQDGEFSGAAETLHIHGEVLLQGDGGIGDLVQVGKDRVKAVGEPRENRAVLGEGHEGEVQDVVGAVGQEDVLRPAAVEGGQLFPKGGPLGVGVQPQVLDILVSQGRQDLGGGGIGGLVGVQLDVLFVPGLFPGGVGLETGVLGVQKSAHGFTLPSPWGRSGCRWTGRGR